MSKTNFDLSTIRGVIFDVDGVLSPSTIPMNDDGVPMRMVNIKDGYAVQLAVKRGLKIAIITGANTPSIAVRYNALGIEDVYLKAAEKVPIMQQWLKKEKLKPQEVAYCGDDIPDIPAMQKVGLAVAPADAAHEVKEIAYYVTHAQGGYGVARELIEQILRAKDMWINDNKAFGW
jgi:3-deoxy-D-manno-octulosonate 8-phosphate phosphatase (KDO 8-P phosphatase)